MKIRIMVTPGTQWGPADLGHGVAVGFLGAGRLHFLPWRRQTEGVMHVTFWKCNVVPTIRGRFHLCMIFQ